jgi:phosphoribosylglycinamide formyltransferase-1
MLASHVGSTVQAVARACAEGRLDAEPAVLISNNADAGVLAFAREHGIPARHLSGRTHRDPAALDAAILGALREHGTDLVLLLGYMKLLGPRTIEAYRGRALNIHPGPLPRYGGRGMFGAAVHRAVIAARERETAVTIHQVDEVYDHGPVVASAPVPVRPDDTPDTLAARVLEREHGFLVETLARIAAGELAVPGLPASDDIHVKPRRNA